LRSARAQWCEAVPALLDKLRLTWEEVTVTGTPRRLIAVVRQLAPRQAESVTEVKGPPVERAFDDKGALTPAGAGFAKKNDVSPESLVRRNDEKGRACVYAIKRDPGKDASEVLAGALPDLVAGLKFDRSMRWDQSGVAFSRPVRWLLCLHGSRVVPF